jgi:nicotinate phosphoribosyltransferase family protein
MNPTDLALLTDLYQLTMAASYFTEGMTGPATFSFFVRSYPPERAAGASLAAPEVIALRDEPAAAIASQLGVDSGAVQPRLTPVMGRGRVVEPLPALAATRTYHQAERTRLPDAVPRLRSPQPWPVILSARLQREQEAASESRRKRMEIQARQAERRL